MDSSFTIKPRAAVQRYTARDPVAVRQAVETELDPAKSVAATTDSGADQREKRHDHAPPDVIADPEARDLIMRENDIRNQGGEHPDQALLRLRAYRPARTEPEPTTTEPHANIKA
jgi:hypothetical protein